MGTIDWSCCSYIGLIIISHPASCNNDQKCTVHMIDAVISIFLYATQKNKQFENPDRIGLTKQTSLRSKNIVVH